MSFSPLGVLVIIEKVLMVLEEALVVSEAVLYLLVGSRAH